MVPPLHMKGSKSMNLGNVTKITTQVIAFLSAVVGMINEVNNGANAIIDLRETLKNIRG